MDANFRLKCTSSEEDHHHLEKISGLEGYEHMWLKEEDIRKYDGDCQEQVG